jgi:FKBP-type peptidyl-prolyl cis-trans isomerase SlpA
MIKEGTKVKLHYTGKFEDGTVFDSSMVEDREPIEFVVGSGMLIPGFEQGVIGMNSGDKKTIEVEPSQGYGEFREELSQEVSVSQLPEGVQVGDVLTAETPAGPINVVVKEINEDKAIVDANHPMAGKTLIFDLEILEAQ